MTSLLSGALIIFAINIITIFKVTYICMCGNERGGSTVKVRYLQINK